MELTLLFNRPMLIRSQSVRLSLLRCVLYCQLVDDLKICLSEAFSHNPLESEGSALDSDSKYPVGSKEREKWVEGEIERMASDSVQNVISKHIMWLISLVTDAAAATSAKRLGQERRCSDDSASLPPPSCGRGSTAHAATFEEVMSLALDDPAYEEEEGIADTFLRCTLCSVPCMSSTSNIPTVPLLLVPSDLS